MPLSYHHRTRASLAVPPMFASPEGSALCRMPSHARRYNVQPPFRYPARRAVREPS